MRINTIENFLKKEFEIKKNIVVEITNRVNKLGGIVNFLDEDGELDSEIEDLAHSVCPNVAMNDYGQYDATIIPNYVTIKDGELIVKFVGEFTDDEFVVDEETIRYHYSTSDLYHLLLLVKSPVVKELNK